MSPPRPLPMGPSAGTSSFSSHAFPEGMDPQRVQDDSEDLSLLSEPAACGWSGPSRPVATAAREVQS